MVHVNSKNELARALLLVTISKMEKDHSVETQKAVTTLALSTLQSGVVEDMVGRCDELIDVVDEVFNK